MKHIIDIDNATLVEECKAGDREAMSLLYTRFAPRMLHVISRYVSNQDDAHDILHDGFIAAFTRLDSLRDPDRVEFWLATIMKNLSLKFLQSQNVASILEEIPEDIEDNAEIDEIIDFATLESLITQLPDGYQKVFRLAVLENKSHKEISKILGIAPNSSSSQLFHAKVMLRRLIAERRNKVALVTLLLLLAVCSGFLFFIRNDKKVDIDGMLMSKVEEPGRVAIEDKEDNIEESISIASKTGYSISEEDFRAEEEDLIAEGEDLIAEEKEESEFEGTKEEMPSTAHDRYKDMIAEASSEEGKEVRIQSAKSSKHRGWSAGVMFDAGMVSFNGFGSTLYDSMTEAPGPPDDIKDPQAPTEDGTENTPMRSRAKAIDFIDKLGNWRRKHYLPITVGLSVEKRFTSWGGVETGLAYSYLHSDYEGPIHNAKCHWHYIEIPLKLNLYAYQSDKFTVYGSAGGRVALPVYSNGVVDPIGDSRPTYIGRLGPKPVWSAGVSVGASYRLSKRFNLFLEPSLQYHFPQDAKVPNIWTDDEPWSFSIPIGVRFSW